MIHTIRAKKLFLMLLFIAQSVITMGHTVFTSTGNSNWNTAFSSSGSGSIITYIIQAGDTVTCNTASTSAIDSVIIYGVLTFDNGKKIDLKNTGIVVLKSGGQVTGGNGGSGFRFSSGLPTSGSFNETGLSHANATSGQFISGSPLPVSWLSVDVKRNADVIQINWSTASELNNSHFLVELSTEHGELVTQNMVSSLAENGTSTSILNYNQEIELSGLLKMSDLVCVRITQVDFDGTRSYSQVVIINLQEPKPIQVFSRPKTLVISNKERSKTLIQVYSTTGSKIYEEQIIDNVKEVSIDKPGYYVVAVSSNRIASHVQKVFVP
jgi:hypothetical protein